MARPPALTRLACAALADPVRRAHARPAWTAQLTQLPRDMINMTNLVELRADRALEERFGDVFAMVERNQ